MCRHGSKTAFCLCRVCLFLFCLQDPLDTAAAPLGTTAMTTTATTTSTFTAFPMQPSQLHLLQQLLSQVRCVRTFLKGGRVRCWPCSDIRALTRTHGCYSRLLTARQDLSSSQSTSSIDSLTENVCMLFCSAVDAV